MRLAATAWCSQRSHFRLFPLRTLGCRCRGAGSVAAWPKILAGVVEPNSPGVPAPVAEPNRPPPPLPNKPGEADAGVAGGCAQRPEKIPVAAGGGDGADPGAGSANMGADAVAGACMCEPA